MSNQQIGEDEIPEFDFSKSTRGLHYAGPNATFVFPADRVLLDPEIRRVLSEEAVRQGVPLTELVNAMLKSEIEKRNLRA